MSTLTVIPPRLRITIILISNYSIVNELKYFSREIRQCISDLTKINEILKMFEIAQAIKLINA
jgi:hypothetical protein